MRHNAVVRNEDSHHVSTPESGFALLEALVALAATALVLTLYLQILGRTAVARQILDDRLTVAAFAQSKIDSVGAAEFPVEGTTEGRFDHIFRWKLEMTDDAGGNGASMLLHPWQVRLRVNWERGGAEQSSEFVGVRLIKSGPVPNG